MFSDVFLAYISVGSVPAGGLLAHGICLYSALVDTVSQSSKMVVPIDSPPGMNEGSLCSLPAATLFHFGSSDECNLHFFDG